jgi:hypothetical protein
MTPHASPSAPCPYMHSSTLPTTSRPWARCGATQWAFPMERFCGAIARANKSRRYPYSSINRRVLQLSQLSQIKLSYGLTEELDLAERRENIASGVKYTGYSDLNFVVPKRERVIQQPLIRKVARFISERIGVDESNVRDALADRHFVAWGKMQRIVKNIAGDIVGGDLIRGHHMVSGNRETRDATHVQVSSTSFMSYIV